VDERPAHNRAGMASDAAQRGRLPHGSSAGPAGAAACARRWRLARGGGGQCAPGFGGGGAGLDPWLRGGEKGRLGLQTLTATLLYGLASGPWASWAKGGGNRPTWARQRLHGLARLSGRVPEAWPPTALQACWAVRLRLGRAQRRRPVGPEQQFVGRRLGRLPFFLLITV
jgi:hypothetical protein